MNSIEPIDFTINGNCSGCGRCCSGYLPLTINEILTIKGYIKEHDIKEQKQNIPRSYEDTDCPFLKMDSQYKCSIYEVRPLVCKSFICNSKSQNNVKPNSFEEYKLYDTRKLFFRG